ncbi:SAM-dependent methyltransferase [Candidatus Woesearchaeota archaeon CG10_big_fil_rev_8_21_14_0_10_44_13]|nr:MAG: SAM-dependent methyltransferase [Candidatus Woesearchaeota archaeon CG10_big_fil_rev_8_21_14_0_10_44_13]
MNTTIKSKKKYNCIARFYDLHSKLAEKIWFTKWRKQFILPLKGKILEVGIGTGKNIGYYNKEAEVVGIDFSEKMLQIAEEKLVKSGKRNITLKQMDAENLEFKDNSFDYVVTTCVFCSVPNPIKGLKEIRRVLKPTGKLIMIEHVLSKNPVIALIEHVHNPITKFFMGVNVNRNTKQNIIKSGLRVVEDRNLALLDVFKLVIARK